MQGNQKKVSAKGLLIALAVIANAVVLEQGFVNHKDWYKLLFFTVSFLLITLFAFAIKRSEKKF